MNIKVPYRLAIFAIIIEILIFEIVLMRARREKRSSHSKYSPAQFIKHWLWAARWRGKRGGVPLSLSNSNFAKKEGYINIYEQILYMIIYVYIRLYRVNHNGCMLRFTMRDKLLQL